MSEIPEGFEYDPHGKVNSLAIVEVRTVLSRARTALASIEQDAEIVVNHGRWEKGEYVGRVTVRHPDADDMIAALRRTVVELSRWENRNSARRSR